MIITYCGNLCVKAQIGDVSVSFNPPLRNDGKTPRFSSNVALFSFKDKEQKFPHGKSDSEVFIIDGPGEYEVGGIFIKGVGVPEDTSKGSRINTIYSVLFDDINLCHLGAIKNSEIKPDILESLGTIDILFAPVTGGDVADPSAASKLATSFEPHIVIPLYSNEKGVSNESLKSFLKEEGSEGLSPIDKLTIKKKDIEGKEEDVVVLSPQI